MSAGSSCRNWGARQGYELLSLGHIDYYSLMGTGMQAFLAFRVRQSRGLPSMEATQTRATDACKSLLLLPVLWSTAKGERRDIALSAGLLP